MTTIESYLQEVAVARRAFMREVTGLTSEQSHFKPAPEVWSICENVEHIVWAERAGIYKIWIAIDEVKQARSSWAGDAIHQGLPIESIIAKTWQPKEIVPDIAKPRWGGPIDFWITSLEACQGVLEKLLPAMEGLDPEKIIYPHPISGPLNLYQRIEFLRFHLDRHRQQVKRVKAMVDYPKY